MSSSGGSPPQEKLTEPTSKKTRTPFPVFSSTEPVAVEDQPLLEPIPDPSQTVQVEFCSELSEITRPFDVFGDHGPSTKESRRKINLIHDRNNQPVVFTVTNTGKLYVVAFVNNATAGWQALDITPPMPDASTEVDAFDTLELGDKVHIAVSLSTTVKTSSGDQLSQNVWTTTIDRPTLNADATTGEVAPSILENLQWKEITNAIGDRDISSILLCPSAAKPKGFYIVIGTAAHNEYAATHYIADPDTPFAPWKHLVMSGSAENVLTMQPLLTGNLSRPTGREVGVASLFQQTGGNTQRVCSAEIINESNAQRVRTYVFQTGQLGSVNNIFANVNPWGLTDILIAADKGIGFFSAQAPEVLNSVILPEVSFKQVVCSEVYASPACKMAIFGISNSDELYFIEGTRQLQGSKFAFTASGIPIRTGVSIMSPQYNAATNSSEILYVSNTTNGLNHLIRDPITSLWTESKIEIKMPAGVPLDAGKAAVYMTNITLSNGEGVNVPPGYPVYVTCEPQMHAVCNNRSYLLSSKPIQLRTPDNTGQFDIILPVDPLMGGVSLKISLSMFAPTGTGPEVVEINPSQRVVNKLKNIKSANDLSDARGPKGEVIFTDKSKIEDAAGVLTEFDNMAKNVEGDQSNTKDRVLTAWERDGEGKITKSSKDKGWFEGAVEGTGKFLGEALECLKSAVKTAVKFAIRVVAGVVKFVFSIAGKVLSFAVKALASLLKAVCGFLKDYLGIDLSRLTKWLGVFFSVENAKKTQKFLVHTINGMFGAAEDFLVHNKYRVEEWMDDIEEKCKKVLPDARVEDKPEGKKSKLLTALTWIFKNPVVKWLLKNNPLTWAMEAAGEELSEQLKNIKIPSISGVVDAFSDSVSGLAAQQAQLFLVLFNSVVSELAAVWKEPSKIWEILKRILSDLFYTAFDTVKNVVSAVINAIIGAVKGIKEFITGAWKIPGLTDKFEKETGMEFSLLNCGTYVMAVILNIGHSLFGSSKRELIFDGIELLDWKNVKPAFVETSAMKKAAQQPPGPNDIVVHMASADPPANVSLRAQYAALEAVSLFGHMSRTTAALADAGTTLKPMKDWAQKKWGNPKVGKDGFGKGPFPDTKTDWMAGVPTQHSDVMERLAKKYPDQYKNGTGYFKQGAKWDSKDLLFGKSSYDQPQFPSRPNRLGGAKTSKFTLDQFKDSEEEPDVPGKLAIGLTTFDTVLSIAKMALRCSLVEKDPGHTSEVVMGTSAANMLFLIIGTTLTIASNKRKSEKMGEIAGIVIGIGGCIEWTGDTIDKAMDKEKGVKWEDVVDGVASFGGLVGSVMDVTGVVIPPFFNGEMILVLDVFVAGTAFIGGLADIEKNVDEAEEAHNKKQKKT